MYHRENSFIKEGYVEILELILVPVKWMRKSTDDELSLSIA